MRACIALVFTLLPVFPPIIAVADDGAASIEAAGTAFPALLAGSGTPIVLVHGMFADNRSWSGFVETLGSAGRLIAYTQRGFGAGSWEDPTFGRDRHTEDLVAIVRSLGETSDLVGWSYGGSIVLGAAAEVPELVGRVALYEPFVPDLLGGSPEADAAAEAFGALWAPTEAALDAGDDVAALKAAIEAAVSLPPGGFSTQDPAVQAMQLDNVQTVRLSWNAPEPEPITCEELGRIRAPTLIIYGTASHPAFAVMAKAVAACMPDATVAAMEGRRHDAPLTAAAEVASLTRDFLAAR